LEYFQPFSYRSTSFLATFIALYITAQANQVLECDYGFDGSYYICYIKNANITSATDPLTITGTHVNENEQKDVSYLRTQELPRSVKLNYLHASIFSEFPNLQTINLENVDLKFLNIPNCAGLVQITLEQNSFTSIPSRTFQNCANLYTLSMYRNQITTVFEDSFRGLTNLKVLNLGGNSNIELSNTSLSDSNLALLRFSGNINIEVGALSHMTDLVSVLISNNQTDFGYFENLLRGLDKLYSISLSYNRLEQVNFNFLAGFSALRFLYLDYNKLTSIRYGAFENMHKLEHLQLMDNQLSDLYDYSFVGLQAPTLYLDGNLISDLSGNPFAGLDKLTFLSLKRNQLSDLAGVTFAPNLRSLNLESNKISTIGPQTFVNLPNLDTLRLTDNEIVRLNSNAFENVRNLTTFGVSYNLLDSIEPNFFRQFPMLKVFEGRNNYCINEIVSDVDSIDFLGEHEFSLCFYYWQYGTTTTLGTTQTTPTTTAPGSGVTLKFEILTLVITLAVLKFH
jgi:Leucine-rich repeat (LRR) protein